MDYISTRGSAPILTFKEALLVGLAEDGGLYVPQHWPKFSAEKIRSFRGMPYTDVAFHIISAFVDGEIKDALLRKMIDEAYATFHHPAVVPLVQTGADSWVLELFHGPTLAFKDVAMQILAKLMDHILTEQGRRLTIVGATSGDTGGAALEAFKDCEGIDTFFMFPSGKVSDVQRRQMTTIGAANAHAIAIDGSFDDCQSMVKAMFADHGFRDAVQLSAVNSINWGRVMAQTVYYFTAAAALGAPDRDISFTVPTGNFGDIFAGYVAKQMGLGIDRLVIATNENDILSRTLASGSYTLAEVEVTITPSMDIQISSNFERLLFDAVGRDPSVVKNLMSDLTDNGDYALPESAHRFVTELFSAGSASQAQTLEMMGEVYNRSGYLADPHTAVAMRVAEQAVDQTTPMVTLATAHPAKFPDTVYKATGQSVSVPDWATQRAQNPEILSLIENDLAAVEAFIIDKSRIGSGRNAD
ncbi:MULTISPECIES: threonine synthase [Falsihalocynthiibacter]|uniref:threonine synthase n=1 Tax=Falsihalocynthiibacter TaxID=2854182 RepID=UPI0030012A58